MKFGGSIMSSPEDIERVCGIIGSTGDRRIVVLSALNGITNLLEAMVAPENLNKGSIKRLVRRVRDFHLEMIERCITSPKNRSGTISKIEGLNQGLKGILLGLKGVENVPPNIRDRVLTYGERMSIHILSSVLKERGIRSLPLTSEEIGLRAKGFFLNGTVDIQASGKVVKDVLEPILEEGIIPVVTGFYGCDRDGESICFGRNGSDYSAAVLANLTGADLVEIWKDVPGFMSADPSIIEGARMISDLTYDEASELSFYGALIIHPRTVEPLRGKGIPLVIRNIFDPGQYTMVGGENPMNIGNVRSVTFTRNIGIIKLKGPCIGSRMSILKDIAGLIEISGIRVRSVTSNNGCIMIIMDREDLDPLKKRIESADISEIETVDVCNGLSLVGIVGEGIFENRSSTSDILKIISEKGIDIRIISSGLSDSAYYFIVREEDLSRAVSIVHNDHILKLVEEIQKGHEERIKKDISKAEYPLPTHDRIKILH
jgi:aspartate kinase